MRRLSQHHAHLLSQPSTGRTMAVRTAISAGLRYVKRMRHLRDYAKEGKALSDKLLPSLTQTGRSTYNLFRSELVELQMCL